MQKYLPPPQKFRPKTLDSTDSVDFTHLKRTEIDTVNAVTNCKKEV